MLLGPVVFMALVWAGNFGFVRNRGVEMLAAGVLTGALLLSSHGFMWLLCATAKRRAPLLMRLGCASVFLSLLVSIAVVGHDLLDAYIGGGFSRGTGKFATAVVVIAGAAAVWFTATAILLLSPTNTPTLRLMRLVSAGLLAFTILYSLIVVWLESGGGWMDRYVAGPLAMNDVVVLGVITIGLWIATLGAGWLRRYSTGPAESAPGKPFDIECPRCGLGQVLTTGGDACGRCRLHIMVKVV